MAQNSLGPPLHRGVRRPARSPGVGVGVRHKTGCSVPHLRPAELGLLSGGRTDLHGHRDSGGTGKGLPGNCQTHPAESLLLGWRSPRFQYLHVATC